MAQQQLFNHLPLGKKSLAKYPPWHIIDHACRHCGGRVAQRIVKGESEVRCTECIEKVKGDHLAICCCGATPDSVGVGLECFVNPDITKEVPREIMVREVQREIPKQKPRKKK